MTLNPSHSDSTIRDIHAIREQLSERFNGDIAAILKDGRERQQTSGRRIFQRGELSNGVASFSAGSIVPSDDSPLPTAG